MVENFKMVKSIIKCPDPFKKVRHGSGEMQYEIYDGEILSINVIDLGNLLM